MNKKFFFLASTLGLILLMGACATQPESPTNVPPADTTPGAPDTTETEAPATPLETPTETPLETP